MTTQRTIGLRWLLVVLVPACTSSSELTVPDTTAVQMTVTQAPSSQAVWRPTWDPAWEPSWGGPLDATVVMTGSHCEQEGGAGSLAPGVLSIKFVNETWLDGDFAVVRLDPGQRLSALGSRQRWTDVLSRALIGSREWHTFVTPSRARTWSSPRGLASGRWVVVCWKDLIAAPNGFHMVPNGIVGPIEIR